MTTKQYDFDWNELAFASKKPLKELKATFIAAPRELSKPRFKQLVKELLPSGNLLLGIAKEDYVLGFEDQPQFKTLRQKEVQKIINSVNQSKSQHKIYTLHYFQRELVPIVSKIACKRVVFINGSWQYTFHNSAIFYELTSLQIPFKLVSAFVDETDAKAYEKKVKSAFPPAKNTKSTFVEAGLLDIADTTAKRSFDYSFQTGAVLAKKAGRSYRLLATSYNKVVPFETYAMLYGASREVNFSPPHDLNHYDTVHAEVELILMALRDRIDLAGTSLFINLLPCPTCARMLCDTAIAEVVYRNDHSDGYAVKLLEKAGKKVRRVVI